MQNMDGGARVILVQNKLIIYTIIQNIKMDVY